MVVVSMDEIKFGFKPVGEVVGPAMLAVFHGIESGHGCIVKRTSIGLSCQLDEVIALTEPRELTAVQVERLRSVLVTPESYWTGIAIYRWFPPRHDFLFRLKSNADCVNVAVDLQHLGWYINCANKSYSGFAVAGFVLRAIAKELFPEYASGSKMAMWKKGSLPNKNR